MEQPEAVDLFCGLGGWAEGFLSEGFHVTGYDIEAHDYGTGGKAASAQIAKIPFPLASYIARCFR